MPLNLTDKLPESGIFIDTTSNMKSSKSIVIDQPFKLDMLNDLAHNALIFYKYLSGTKAHEFENSKNNEFRLYF